MYCLNIYCVKENLVAIIEIIIFLKNFWKSHEFNSFVCYCIFINEGHSIEKVIFLEKKPKMIPYLNINSALFGIYSKDCSNLAKNICFKPMQNAVNQSAPGLNRGLSSNLWCLRSTNHVKFLQKNVMYTQEPVLVKNVYKWAWRAFVATGLSRKDSSWRETHQLPGKVKVPGAAASKGHTDWLISGT